MDQPRATRTGPRQRWLCVAYAFPPINRSGTHRTLGFVRHLDELGWDATVLTVEPGCEPTDESLLSFVPDGTEVIRTPWVDRIARLKRLLSLRARSNCPHVSPRGLKPAARHTETGHALKPAARKGAELEKQCASEPTYTCETAGSPRTLREWVSRLLTTPDSRTGWIGPAYRAGLAAIKRQRPEVLYSTSPYMSAHLIALRLSRHTGIPWVADFRDPWVDNPFRVLDFASLRWWDGRLERAVLKQAKHVICNTPTMRARMCQRLPFLAEKSSVILNGFDAELFDDIVPQRSRPADDFVLTHCGQFYGPRNPRMWFEALKLARNDSPEIADRLHLQLLGPEHYDGRPLAKLAAEAGVADRVHVLGSKSHQDTLSYMAGSDALILAGSTGAGAELQVPNKLFEYLAARKPIIAAVSDSSPVVDILAEAYADAVVCEPEDVPALANAFTQLAARQHVLADSVIACCTTSPRPSLSKVEGGGAPPGVFGESCEAGDIWSGVGRFDRRNGGAELERIFHRVSRQIAREPGRDLPSPLGKGG